MDVAINIITKIVGFVPSFSGSRTENIALQNLQARLRMILGYFLAQLIPLVRWKESGFLLVLATENTDESFVGYSTKYDCSSADINLLGYFTKETFEILYAIPS